MSDATLALTFGLSLAIGLLIGLERERRPESKAGVRTFSLITLLGTLSALIAERTASPWFLVGVVAVIGAGLIAAYVLDPKASPDAGTTTVVAALLAFTLGAVLWYGYHTLALALSIVAVTLLHFKTELEGFSHQLTPRDVVSTLQLAVLSFVVLPLLPNDGFGPYNALNPVHIWLMVVLVSAISWAGYVVWRLIGDRRGLPLLGVLGGLVSSTATTLVYARATAKDTAALPASVIIIGSASLVIAGRLAVMSAIAAPAMAPQLGMVLSGALIGGLPALLWWWHQFRRADSAVLPDYANPANVRVALTFGGLYALILLGATWLADVAGSAGLYAFAFASGLTDVDAITLTSLRLFGTGALNAMQASTVVAIAVLANMLFKSILIFAVGGFRLMRYILPVFGGSALGIGIALVWLSRQSPTLV